ncbi:hypothetical protein [Arthrobacter methylotrophus]|uniref:Uncharacterized protein n=1 Tax=Arthrobacter methylotrophus TaxID=121291 RepID=A0ABV5UNQ1_9MICC
MTTITARQPKGIPVGGQFAATAHAEPAAVLTTQPSFQAHSHAELLSDRLNPLVEARVARSAIYDALVRGEFGDAGAQVRALRNDDRLVRLAVDRYVVSEHQEPGSADPEVTGHRLGRLLMDLQDEDIEEAVYALKDGRE